MDYMTPKVFVFPATPQPKPKGVRTCGPVIPTREPNARELMEGQRRGKPLKFCPVCETWRTQGAFVRKATKCANCYRLEIVPLCYPRKTE